MPCHLFPLGSFDVRSKFSDSKNLKSRRQTHKATKQNAIILCNNFNHQRFVPRFRGLGLDDHGATRRQSATQIVSDYFNTVFRLRQGVRQTILIEIVVLATLSGLRRPSRTGSSS